MELRRKAKQLEKLIERKLGGALDTPPEPLDVAREVLEDVEDQIAPAPGGRMTFPYSDVLLHVAVAPEERKRWKSTLEGPSGLESAVLALLERAGCGGVAALKVRYVDKRGDDWSNEWFHVEYRAPRAAKTAAAAIPRVQLAVLKGVATRRRYLFRATRINIGRSTEVLTSAESVLRRNDVVFSDDKIDKPSQTVSRVHAHISYRGADGGFWLHDDNSSKGTRIVRDGDALAVSKGSPRGVKLRSGDLIQLGDATLRFVIVEPEAAGRRRS